MAPFRQTLRESIESALVAILRERSALRGAPFARGGRAAPTKDSYDDSPALHNETFGIEVEIERPRIPEHGDFSCNIALVMAKQVSMSPRELAAAVAERLDLPAQFVSLEVAGPGFLNFKLDPEAWASVVEEVLEAGSRYGAAINPSPEHVNIEFVSANPTGPMHLGHARWAAWGDALARLLETAGHKVTREFYINDAGNQITLLGKTIAAYYLRAFGGDAEPPEDGYKGSYIQDLAQDLVSEVGRAWVGHPREQLIAMCGEWGADRLLEEIRGQLESIGVRFDVWTSEKSLRESGSVSATLEELRKRDFAYEAEGAVWFRSSKLGDQKDRVLVKSDGQPTYLAVDIAYHVDKYKRGFDRFIDIWGADHAGHVPKLRYALEALGYDPRRLEVILGQLVSISRAGEPVRMSKRSGDLYTFEELVEELGPDAARFHFLMQGPDSALHLDLEKAVAHSLDNPVYYVQYAHARICSILHKARDAGLKHPIPEMAKAAPLSSKEEIAVLKRLEEYPYLMSEAASARAPHKLANWARELAAEFHAFYQSLRVLQADSEELTKARLALVAACRQALANCLSILGVRAPERMEKLDDSDRSADED